MTKRGEILFVFRESVADLQGKVKAGSAPSELLYGLSELQSRGWSVQSCAGRPSGRLSRMLERRGVGLISREVLRSVMKCDVLVIKSGFGVAIALIGRLLNRRVVHLDAMFAVPKRWWKRAAARLGARLSHAVVGYSHSQAIRWRQEFGAAFADLKVVPYALDIPFYQANRRPWRPSQPPLVLAVGRDLGRDFRTLVEALDGTGVRLVLVTLPYLVPPLDETKNWVTILKYVPYQQLFDLYAEASVVCVPLKHGVTYPSGVRAMLEGMALGRPVVASYSPVLVEYAQADLEVCFVEPGNPDRLRTAIMQLVGDREGALSMGRRACERVERDFTMARFVDAFEPELEP